MVSEKREHLPIDTVVNISKVVSELWYWLLNDVYLWNRGLDEGMSEYLSNVLWIKYEKWIDKIQR